MLKGETKWWVYRCPLKNLPTLLSLKIFMIKCWGGGRNHMWNLQWVTFQKTIKEFLNENVHMTGKEEIHT